MEECLGDKLGSQYFKKFLQEQFCVESFLFHEAVVEYQATMTHARRIKLGEKIMATFKETGSELEVNLSHGTRFQCTQIVGLVKKMNDNKEKYEKLAQNCPVTPQKAKSGCPVTPLRCRASPATASVPRDLMAVTRSADESIQDVVYSSGFTQSLFDKAYAEIMDLMRINSWTAFRKKIIDICDDELAEKLRTRMEEKRELHRNQLGMIQVINTMGRARPQTPKSVKPPRMKSVVDKETEIWTETESDSEHSLMTPVKYTPDWDRQKIKSFVPSILPSIAKSVTSPAFSHRMSVTFPSIVLQFEAAVID